MILLKKLPLAFCVLIGILSCEKKDAKPDYGTKITGYYTGTTVQWDTLTNTGNNDLIRMKHSLYIQAFVQKNKNNGIEIQYTIDINSSYNGTYITGNGRFNGLIERINLSDVNLFLIDKTKVDLYDLDISVMGNGSYEESTRSLMLNLQVNEKGKTRPVNLKLTRQKRNDE